MEIECLKNCKSEDRKILTDDGICNIICSSNDGLPVRCVGSWAKEKIHYLIRYFEIFAGGMKDKWGGNINYIEICSGPGKCVIRETGEEIDGTALQIINSPASKFLKRALFFDNNSDVVSFLNKRIESSGFSKAIAFTGDYYHPNDLCKTILSDIDPKSLNLVFVDPTDCSVPFELFSTIKKHLPKADLIINVASHTDFNRNVKMALLNPEQYQKVRNKYCEFLGNDDYFRDEGNIKLAEKGNNLTLRLTFREFLKSNLQSLGYNFFGEININRFYDIIFASENARGLDFWKKATSKDSSGQQKMF